MLKAIAATTAVLLAVPCAAQEASSSNYIMQTSATTMAGGESESETYKAVVSVGLPAGGGEMSSASYTAEMSVVISSLDGDGDGVSGTDDICPTEYSGCYDLDFDGCIDVPDADADLDGTTAGSCDCDEGDGTIWGTPGEVRNLLLTHDAAGITTIEWDPPGDPGGTAPLYDTIRSADLTDFVGAAICVETDDASDTESIDGGDPTSGGLFLYLVRAENGCASGTGPLGSSQGVFARTALDCSL